MKIIPKRMTTFDFFVEVDGDGKTLRYEQLTSFFSEYPDQSVLVYITDRGSFEVDRESVLDNIQVFDYLTHSGILRSTHVIGFFWINDTDKFTSFIKELSKIYLDIRENYDMYKRDFEIDEVLS
jgi:hypothetical protein